MGSTDPQTNPDANVRISITVTGSGGVGDGVDVRIGSRVVRVRPDRQGELELAAGAYDVQLEFSPQWCEVGDPPALINAPATGFAVIALTANCVGGIIYESTPSSIHTVTLRMITPDGFDVQFTDLFRGRHQVQAWSPDGRQVAIATGLFSDPPHVLLWDLDAGNFDAIPFAGLGHYQPAWSPDTQQLAFIFGDPALEGRLMIASRDGQDPIPLLPGSGPDAAPAWSPDGQQIAFATARTRGYETLHVVGSDGTGLRELDDRFAQNVSWSFDGQWIAYARQDEVALIRPAGTDLVIVDEFLFATIPRWSPTRRVIGFSILDSLYSYDVDLDERRTIMTDPDGIRSWSWSADGEWVLFSVTRATESELRVVRKDGTDSRTVLTTQDRIRGVTWDPTGRP